MSGTGFPTERVLEVISTAEHSLDADEVRRKVIQVFFQSFPVEGAVLFLPDDNRQFTHTLVENHSQPYNKLFTQYYHRFDPLQLMRSSPHDHLPPRPVMVNYNDWKATEYYQDFLKPQGIHYKLVVPLKTREGLQGKLILTRSVRAKGFSGKEANLAHALSPYLAYALVHNKLRRQIQFQDNLLHLMADDSSAGMLLLDKSFHPIYMNRQAKELCARFAGGSAPEQRRSGIHPLLLEDCQLLQEQLKGSPSGMLLPRQRTISGADSRTYVIYSKVVPDGSGPQQSLSFMIHIRIKSPTAPLAPAVLTRRFQLSPRETEVVQLVCQGLRNLEIAERLFVTEITVKKHIQKIYAKVGVKNRTSLMHKMLAL